MSWHCQQCRGHAQYCCLYRATYMQLCNLQKRRTGSELRVSDRGSTTCPRFSLVFALPCTFGHQGPSSPSSVLLRYLLAGSYTFSLPARCSCQTATAVNNLVLLPMGYLQAGSHAPHADTSARPGGLCSRHVGWCHFQNPEPPTNLFGNPLDRPPPLAKPLLLELPEPPVACAGLYMPCSGC